MDGVQRVGVVGCGAIGSGIAEVCAQSDLDVQVVLPTKESVERGRRRLVTSVDRRVAKGKLTEPARDALLRRVSFGSDFDALADRQFVFEAVSECEQTKLLVLKQIDASVRTPDVVLASSTSSVPIMRLARGAERSNQVIGVHFFYPVPVLKLVELTSCLLTDQRTRTAAEQFVTGVLGKQVIWAKDRAGFVVNHLLVPYLLSAIRMLDSGFANAEDIDTGMELGCAHPMGPLRLADLLGLDIVSAVAQSMYEEFKEPTYSPPALLRRMVDAGMLGRKTGRGFYPYDG